MQKHQCEQKVATEEALAGNEFLLKRQPKCNSVCMNRALPEASVAFVEVTVTLQMQTMELHAFALLVLSLTDISHC